MHPVIFESSKVFEDDLETEHIIPINGFTELNLNKPLWFNELVQLD